jgi:predicted outer membrane repeat protein
MILSICFGMSGSPTAHAQMPGTETPTSTYPPTAPPALLISGYVVTSSGSGISGVELTGLPSNPITDENGYYFDLVAYGWSGMVMPMKTLYVFDPIHIGYTNLTSSQYDQNYTGSHNYPSIYHAKPVASGTGTCQSWINACTLQDALAMAISGDEIWVAAGVYKPTTGKDRTATFQLKNGVAVYGGFAGMETVRHQRNPAANLAILSGDIDNDDSQTPVITDPASVTGNTTNSFHVVTNSTSATLDGFTITAGFADGEGGGLYNTSSNLTLTNVTFSGNSADVGGGMFNLSSSPTLTNVTFSGNSANHGGGMFNELGSSPTLANVTFSSNSVTYYGGGMLDEFNSSPTLTNVTFSNNSAGQYGGGIHTSNHSNPLLTNVTFSGNSATYGGGGMFIELNSYSMLTNVTFSGNTAGYYGGGMWKSGDSGLQIHNVIFWGNTATYAGAQVYNTDTPGYSYLRDSVVQNGCPVGSTCTNIVTADPLLGTLGDYGGFTQTIPLLEGSSAIDAGDDVICPAADQRGIPRPQGTHCDIGAFEVLSNNTGFSIFLPLILR